MTEIRQLPHGLAKSLPRVFLAWLESVRASVNNGSDDESAVDAIGPYWVDTGGEVRREIERLERLISAMSIPPPNTLDEKTERLFYAAAKEPEKSKDQLSITDFI